jgi:hypothetical protein
MDAPSFKEQKLHMRGFRLKQNLLEDSMNGLKHIVSGHVDYLELLP